MTGTVYTQISPSHIWTTLYNIHYWKICNVFYNLKSVIVNLTNGYVLNNPRTFYVTYVLSSFGFHFDILHCFHFDILHCKLIQYND